MSRQTHSTHQLLHRNNGVSSSLKIAPALFHAHCHHHEPGSILRANARTFPANDVRLEQEDSRRSMFPETPSPAMPCEMGLQKRFGSIRTSASIGMMSRNFANINCRSWRKSSQSSQSHSAARRIVQATDIRNLLINRFLRQLLKIAFHQ